MAQHKKRKEKRRIEKKKKNKLAEPRSLRKQRRVCILCARFGAEEASKKIRKGNRTGPGMMGCHCNRHSEKKKRKETGERRLELYAAATEKPNWERAGGVLCLLDGNLLHSRATSGCTTTSSGRSVTTRFPGLAWKAAKKRIAHRLVTPSPFLVSRIWLRSVLAVFFFGKPPAPGGLM